MKKRKMMLVCAFLLSVAVHGQWTAKDTFQRESALRLTSKSTWTSNNSRPRARTPSWTVRCNTLGTESNKDFDYFIW